MTANRRLILCAAFGAATLAYLAADLWFFRGPARQAIESFRPDSPRSIGKAKADGVVARVGFHPIHRDQLDRAVTERLWLEGRVWEEVPVAERPALRQAAMEELIDGLLLRQETVRQGKTVQVEEEQVFQASQRFAARFANEAELKAALRKEGLSDDDLRLRLTARLEQQERLDLLLGESTKVSDEDAREWLRKHAGQLRQPTRVRVRQVFLATLERDPEQAKRQLEQALLDLRAGRKDFAALALELSDDAASKQSGGELGWLVRDRLPPDFAQAVFSLPPRTPTLIRTTLGWHLVELTAAQSESDPFSETVLAETKSALRALKRRDAVAALRVELRRRHGARIEVWLDEAGH